MATFAWVLVESLPVLGLLLFLVNFVLLVHWRRSGRAQPLLITLLVSVVLLSVSFAVETRRETAKRILDAIATDVRFGRVAALDGTLSPDFEAPPMDRATFLDAVRNELRRTKVLWNRRTRFVYEPGDDERFRVKVTYLSQLLTDEFGGPLKTRWEIVFRRIAGDWRIETIEPPTIDGITFRGWTGP